MLISRVMPLMSIYRLPHGQLGYKGHVLNLPQEVGTFATTLPRKPSELDIILVRREGSQDSHQDFRVRRSVLLAVLLWLKQNNKYYRDIAIDQATLNTLPNDVNITLAINVQVEGDNNNEQSDDNDSEEISTFVPSIGNKLTEQENIKNQSRIIKAHTPKKLFPGLKLEVIPSMNSLQRGTSHVHFPPFYPLVLKTFWHHVSVVKQLGTTSSTY